MRTTLLDTELHLHEGDLNGYVYVDLDLSPPPAQQLEIAVEYSSAAGGRLFLSVISPNGLCGFSMEKQRGVEQTLKIIIAETHATPGSIPTPIESGAWRLVFDPHGFKQAAPFHLHVALADADPSLARPAPAQHRYAVDAEDGAASPAPVATAPRWYKGELHSHTYHSDGVDSPAELIDAARRYGLDYLAMTDHNTIAGWKEIEAEIDADTLGVTVIKSLEITSKKGHANVHGIRSWIDALIDREDHGFNVLVEDLKGSDGSDVLVSVNHAFSNFLGWQQHDTDWSRVDLIEVYHALENQHNTLQLAHWDHLLAQGYAIVGIGGTDSHDANTKKHKLGVLTTHVHADSRAAPDILAGLRRGRVFVTVGPTMEFHATQRDRRREMFESLDVGEPAEFVVELKGVVQSAELYVIKNGLFFGRLPVTTHDATLRFSDVPERPSYYRVELHVRPFFKHNPNANYRSWDSFAAASNPIFAGAAFERGRWR